VGGVRLVASNVKYSVAPLMRRTLLAVILVLAACAVPVQAFGGASAQAVAQPRVAAAAWYVLGEDGSVVAQHDARVRRPIASITKLMTAVVALEQTRLSDIVTVSSGASSIGESTVFLRPGEQLTIADLVRGALVRSANDAAEALALHVGQGSATRFVALMNAKARELGLTDTTFANAHGLDTAGHVSSARDTTLLARYALGIPFIRETLDRSLVVLPGGRVFPTTDDLLESWPPLLGGKTGHTAGAGWSEAAGARAGGITVYGTVLGSDTRSERNDALRTLLSYGLARYRRVAAIDPGRVYAEAATGYGKPSVELVARRALVRTVRDRTPLVERVVAPTVVSLPVREGEPLGSVEVYARNRLVAAAKLVAASAVSEPGMSRKVAWYARRTVHHLRELVT
jgi:D-alanyl-D-alanine carboxypeptidase (penicillin-binding protein 5/6)